MKIKVINTTTDSHKIAEQLAEILLQQNLSPCVQIIPEINSTYKWKGSIEKADELLLIIKTIPENVMDCKKTIFKQHNYETPELIVSEADIISDEYREWFIENSRE